MDEHAIRRCSVALRKHDDLGSTQWSGLTGTHHFSFAAYQRVDRLHWGGLRALNLYRLEPGAVRSPTFHAGFEIVTLVTGGRLRRTGTFSPRRPLGPHMVELLSTGTGANLGCIAADDETARYVEIWVRSTAASRRALRQCLTAYPVGLDQPLASGPGESRGSLSWRADGQILHIALEAGEKIERAVSDDLCPYLAVLHGDLSANGIVAESGDGLAIGGPGRLMLEARTPSECLLIETVRQDA